MRWLFIINPTAGKVDASVSLMPRIRAAAARAGIEPSIVVTRHAGHAREITAACAESGEEVRVYACGGDGTMNEVLQAAAGKERIAVGCIPCGSGNDYVRNFGTQADFLNLDAQFVAECRQADLIRTPQGYGIDIYAAGIDAQVANGIAKWRRVPLCGGTTAYTLSILEAACGTFRHRLRIQTDQGEMEGIYMMLAVCNAQMYGGGYCAAPYASMDDGLLDVVLLKPVPRLKLAGLLKGYRQGRHLAPDGTVEAPFRPYMTFLRTSQIDVRVLDEKPLIATLDGECSPQMHLHAEVARRGVRILLPPELARNTPVLQVMGE
ncbi:MAG: diacylglycerol/lipid kinase family protein [Blautia massiliensis (ex Durand et al. 2017)]